MNASHWKQYKLNKIATAFLGGGTPSTKRTELWRGNMPWITTKWLNDSLYVNTGQKFISSEALTQ